MSTFEFKLPDLGEGIAEAEVISWAVGVADTVEAHQILLTVETDKAQVELPSPTDGTVLALGAEVGGSIKVGSVVATFEVADAASDMNDIAHPQTEVASFEAAAGVPAQPTQRRVLAAPTTRKLATEMSVAIGGVTGTGPGGRVLKEDVLAAANGGVASTPTAPATVAAAISASPHQRYTDEVTTVPLRGMRRTIARKMTEVIQTVPMVSGHFEVDVTDAAVLLAELQPQAAAQGVRLTWTALFALSTIHALRQFPAVNATLDMDAEELTVHRSINLGMATNIDGGLVVPIIRDAGRLSLLELAAEIERLAELARTRSISTADLTGGTFTLTNYGAVGGWFGTMILNTPEVAIAGFGKAVQKPVVVNGEIVARTVLPLSSTIDHRVVDGALGTQFTSAIKARLEYPHLLLLGARHGDG